MESITKSNKIVGIYKNDSDISAATAAALSKVLVSHGFIVLDGYHNINVEYSNDGYGEWPELLFIIGGDGSLLRALHEYDFPSVPIVGINTGHLGFFQELHPEDIEGFIKDYLERNYTTQNLSTVEAIVDLSDRKVHQIGLNEIIVRGKFTSSTHLKLSVGDSFVEDFVGDGILISTPAGSTAYNYSLGGAIVDPRLNVLQVTPISPMNSTAYRSFTSSLVFPSDVEFVIRPETSKDGCNTYVLADGFETSYSKIEKITVRYSEHNVQLLRFKNYDFWHKVKAKFL